MIIENQFAVGVIGVGNMGSALVRGIVNKSGIEAKSIIICDVDKVKVESLCRDLGVVDGIDANNTSKLADLVILASKPQNMSTLLERISKSIKSNQTIMSIAAGITINSIESVLFGDIPIVRVMPNLPAVVGEGMSIYCRGTHVGDTDLERVRNVLDAVGICLQAPEDLMDAFTALSGTGPAYVFYTIEVMIESGIEMGMSREIAEKLVLQTVFGSALLAMKSELNPTDLRKEVTSKGGTTDAAISHLKENNYTKIVIEAILKARDRSRELGDLN
jgi:pyrroline-5-carboxylate reductase